MLYSTEEERAQANSNTNNNKSASSKNDSDGENAGGKYCCQSSSYGVCSACSGAFYEDSTICARETNSRYHVQCFIDKILPTFDLETLLSTKGDFKGVEKLPEDDSANLEASFKAAYEIKLSSQQVEKKTKSNEDIDVDNDNHNNNKNEDNANDADANNNKSSSSSSSFTLPDQIFFPEDATDQLSDGDEDKYPKTSDDFKAMLSQGKYSFLDEFEAAISSSKTNDDLSKLTEEVENFLTKNQVAIKVTHGYLITKITPVHFAALLGFHQYLERLYKLLKTAIDKLPKTEEEATKEDEASSSALPNNNHHHHPLIKRVFIDNVTVQDRTITEFACRGGHRPVFEFLHNHGFLFPFQPNELKALPLYVLIQSSDAAESLKYLVDNFAEMKSHLETWKSEKSSENYLHLACRKCRKNTIEYLIENMNIDVSARTVSEGDTYSTTAFAIACLMGKDDEIVRYLFKKGAAQPCLDEMNECGKTVTGKLRQMKADEEIEVDVDTATDEAAEKEDETIKKEKEAATTKYFVKSKYFPVMPLQEVKKMEQDQKSRIEENNKKKKETIEPSENDNETKNDDKNNTSTKSSEKSSNSIFVDKDDSPLIDATRRYILSGQKKRYKTNSPLTRAAENQDGGSLLITKFLCEEAGFDADKNRLISVSSPLYFAAKTGNLETVRYLLEERKADPDLCDPDNCTPIYAAAWFDFADIVKVLLKNGANSSIRFKKYHTPAIGASNNSSLNAIKALAENGGDVTTPCEGYTNVREYAEACGHNEIAEYLSNYS